MNTRWREREREREMREISVLTLLTLTQLEPKVLKHQEKYEKEILDTWAENYVEAFFQPSLASQRNFPLGSLNNYLK